VPQGRHRSNSFVVRIWWEQEGKHAIWRGWVQHAGSGEVHHFDQLARLLAFIQTHTGPLVQSLNTKPGDREKKTL